MSELRTSKMDVRPACQFQFSIPGLKFALIPSPSLSS